MLNFTDHMKRIIVLAERTLVHTQEEKYPMALDDLFRIGILSNEAVQQLDEMILKKYQGTDPSKNLN